VTWKAGPGALSLLGASFACLVAGLGCDQRTPTVMIHADESEAARALWSIDFVREFTVPEPFRFQTEEYGSAVADPSRGLVYVGSRDGTLLALDDRVGEVMWETEIGGGLSSVPILAVVDRELGSGHEPSPGERPDWMITGTDDGSLVALDLDSREIVWRYRTGGLVRRPAVIGEHLVYFANSRDQILAVDLRAGEWVWEFDGEFQKDFTVYGRAGLAYVPGSPSGSSTGSSSELSDAGAGAEEAAAEDEAAAEEQVAAEDDAAAEEQVAGVVYTGFADGKVIAIDAASGSTKWVESLAPVDGKALFVDIDTTPVIVPERGELLVANQTSGVFALALTDGAQHWNTPLRAVGSLAAAPGGLVLAASSLEGLFALEPDGRVRWHQQLDPGSLATPLVVGGTVIIAHSDVGLLAYATANGELLGFLFNGSGSSGQPSYDPVLGRVYASSDRGSLYALRLR
jgi:outer membrane protein assembly factor BamB